MSWAKVNEERREKAVPAATPTPKPATGMGAALDRRLAKGGK